MWVVSAFQDTPMSDLVSCSFSTILICPFYEFFHLLVSTFYIILAFSKIVRDCMYGFGRIRFVHIKGRGLRMRL